MKVWHSPSISNNLGFIDKRFKNMLDLIRLKLTTREEIAAGYPSLLPLYSEVSEKYAKLCAKVQVHCMPYSSH